MPVINTEKMWSRRNSTAAVTENFRKLTVSFTEAYSILVTHDTTELEIYLQADLPAVGQSFPGFPFVLASQAQLERVSPIMWIATVNYSGEIGGLRNLGGNTNPTSPFDARPRLQWDDVETEAEIDEDFDGQPIVNTAGERFRGVKALFSDQTLTVTRNMLLFNPYAQAVYRRSVNSDLFMGWPPGTCKLMKLSAQNVLDEQNGYWTVTGVFQFRYPYNTTPDKAWYARWLNVGLNQRRTVGQPELEPCYDGNDTPAVTPQYLDADGRQTDEAGAIWNETKLYNSLPYNLLGLI